MIECQNSRVTLNEIMGLKVRLRARLVLSSLMKPASDLRIPQFEWFTRNSLQQRFAGSEERQAGDVR